MVDMFCQALPQFIQLLIVFSIFSLLLSIAGQLSELILNQHSILRRMVYRKSPGNTSFWSMLDTLGVEVAEFDQLLIFFSIFSLLLSIAWQVSELILNQHSILRRMVYRESPGNTSL